MSSTPPPGAASSSSSAAPRSCRRRQNFVVGRLPGSSFTHHSQLANIDDVFNGVLIRGDATGDVVFYGRGSRQAPDRQRRRRRYDRHRQEARLYQSSRLTWCRHFRRPQRRRTTRNDPAPVLWSGRHPFDDGRAQDGNRPGRNRGRRCLSRHVPAGRANIAFRHRPDDRVPASEEKLGGSWGIPRTTSSPVNPRAGLLRQFWPMGRCLVDPRLRYCVAYLNGMAAFHETHCAKIWRDFGERPGTDLQRRQYYHSTPIRTGNNVIAVVSAQGDTTDDLIEKAREINPNASKREMDMLLVHRRADFRFPAGHGHRNAWAIPVISLNGRQAGFCHRLQLLPRPRSRRSIPNGSNGNWINGGIVIVTGFQGINRYDDITTLGRGGSGYQRRGHRRRAARPTSARSTPTWTAFTPPTPAWCPRPRSSRRSPLTRCWSWPPAAHRCSTTVRWKWQRSIT